MTLLFFNLTFIYFVINVLVLCGYLAVCRKELSDLFRNGLKHDVSCFAHLIILTTLIYFPIYYAVAHVVPTELVELNVCGLYLYFTIPTIVMGVIFTLLYSPVWYNTLGGDGSSLVLGMLVAVMFGAFFSTFLATAYINAEDISSVFGYYVSVALDILRLISMMAVLPIIERMVRYVYQIFRNNIAVALRGALFSAFGGVFGVGTLLAMIPLFTTATVAGIFGGLLVRNNIDNVFAPLLAIIAVLGLPPIFWHTFYEFTAFGFISASVGLLVGSLVSREERRFKYAISGIVVGTLILLFGAFIEVTASASIAGILRHLINFAPVISNISLSPCYVVSMLFAYVVVLVMTALVAYALLVLVKVVEEVVA